MAIVDLIMPKMGESIMEATILKWNKQPGDYIQQDESLLEIATDKVDSEVPSTAAGVLKEILFSENAVVPVGSVIAKIETSVLTAEHPTQNAQQKTAFEDPFIQHPSSTLSNTSSDKSDIEEPLAQDEFETSERPAAYRQSSTTNGQRSTADQNRFYSPLVLNIASNEGISLGELEKIHGTGNEGRVTKKDILLFVAKKKEGNGFGGHPSAAETAYTYSHEVKASGSEVFNETKTPQPESVITNISGNVEIQEMDRMRKLIAEHMVRSKHTSPHVTSFTEADVTNLFLWREKEKAEFEKREGTKLTLTPLFIEAVIKCIKKYPLINSSLQGDKIIIRRDINIGMATALPSGSLIVPVIKNADNYNRVGLARQVNTLANNARINKLKPEDIQDGTFTLTNVGVFGSLMGTPIINQPQVAILAVGAIKKRPVVIETEQGDAIGIRHMMYLSMSYDHRIIDGSLGATFLTEVAKELEAFQA
jgi:2-oxoglutarate dehydrogenase E2 component (dihydrolipoamide succinyltransferase)